MSPQPFQRRVARLLPSLDIPSQGICRPIWKSAFSPTGIAELRQATDADGGGSSPGARTPRPAQRHQGVLVVWSPCPPPRTWLTQFSFPQCGTGLSVFTHAPLSIPVLFVLCLFHSIYDRRPERMKKHQNPPNSTS